MEEKGVAEGRFVHHFAVFGLGLAALSELDGLADSLGLQNFFADFAYFGILLCFVLFQVGIEFCNESVEEGVSAK